MPERVDLDRLREEAVAAEVEAVAVDLDRLREPADLILGLEHATGRPTFASRYPAVSPAGPPPRTSTVPCPLLWFVTFPLENRGGRAGCYPLRT